MDPRRRAPERTSPGMSMNAVRLWGSAWCVGWVFACSAGTTDPGYDHGSGGFAAHTTVGAGTGGSEALPGSGGAGTGGADTGGSPGTGGASTGTGGAGGARTD